MSVSFLDNLKIKAKLLQKAKQKNGQAFALKDAFNVLARSRGFTNWRDYKSHLQEQPDFCPPGTSAYWKHWYASYDEARAHQAENGYYLLPYQKQFFLCDIHYINALGIAADDSDLTKVGMDWTQPQDAAAWQRLLQKIKSPLHS